MKGLILLLIAWILILPATLVNVILVASKAKHNGWVKWLSGYSQNTAKNLDIFACGEFKTLWNTIMITDSGIQFDEGKTISYYLGANKINNSLSKFGKFIAFICNLVDKNHCENAYYKNL